METWDYNFKQIHSIVIFRWWFWMISVFPFKDFIQVLWKRYKTVLMNKLNWSMHWIHLMLWSKGWYSPRNKAKTKRTYFKLKKEEEEHLFPINDVILYEKVKSSKYVEKNGKGKNTKNFFSIQKTLCYVVNYVIMKKEKRSYWFVLFFIHLLFLLSWFFFFFISFLVMIN